MARREGGARWNTGGAPDRGVRGDPRDPGVREDPRLGPGGPPQARRPQGRVSGGTGRGALFRARDQDLDGLRPLGSGGWLSTQEPKTAAARSASRARGSFGRKDERRPERHARGSGKTRKISPEEDLAHDRRFGRRRPRG